MNDCPLRDVNGCIIAPPFCCNSEHALYAPKDFTSEEYDRRNQLAVMVIDGGLSVCKQCGDYEGGLQEICPRSLKWPEFCCFIGRSFYLELERCFS